MAVDARFGQNLVVGVGGQNVDAITPIWVSMPNHPLPVWAGLGGALRFEIMPIGKKKVEIA